ncbi:MAG: Hpt domain-containing protein [bacterium]|nr:Hpt domain-containing protein [bacterium]
MNREEKLKLLEELGGISEEDFDELYKVSVQDISDEFSKFNDSFTGDDYEGMKKAVHAIKGISGNFRINGVYEISVLLELAIKETSNTSIIDGYIKRLAEEMKTISS